MREEAMEEILQWVDKRQEELISQGVDPEKAAEQASHEGIPRMFSDETPTRRS